MIKSPYNILYPKDGSLIHLDGGMDTTFDPKELQDNESTYNYNIVYDKDIIRSRGPLSPQNVPNSSSTLCHGLYTYHDNSGTEKLIMWAAGTGYYHNVSTFTTIPSAQSVYCSAIQVYAAEQENYIFFGNGQDTPYKYNGTEFTRHGIYPATATMSVSNAATGAVLTGDYQYAMTNVNSNLVESDLSPITATFTLAGQNGLLSSIPVAPTSFGVSSRYIYRTKASGAVYYRVGSIADNSTTTFEDGVSDSDLVLEAPEDQGVPPCYSVVLYHQSRLFIIDPTADSVLGRRLNLVKYSELGNPYVFKALNFIRVGDNTGDIPQTLGIYDNSVVIFCSKSIWLLYMPSSDDTSWQLIKNISQYGCKAPRSIFYYNNKLMFAAYSNEKFVGFAAMIGNSVELDTTLLTRSTVASHLKSEKITETIETYHTNPDTFFVQVFEQFALIDSIGSAYPIYFDFSTENYKNKNEYRWSRWRIPAYVTGMAVYNGYLYIIRYTTLYKYYHTTDNYYDSLTSGSTVAGIINTKSFYGELKHKNWTKEWRWLWVTWTPNGCVVANQGGLKVEIYLDESTTATKTIYIVHGAGETSIRETKLALGGVRSKTIQVKITCESSATDAFSTLKLTGIRFSYNLRGLR